MFKKWLWTTAVFLLLLTLAACSNSEETEDGTAGDAQAETETGSSTEEETTSSEPKAGGKVVVAIPQDIDNLDPKLAEAAGTREVFFNVFEGLLKETPSGDLTEALAESYNVSEDGLEYTFKIRQGVKFHNGADLTAQDVYDSYAEYAGIGKEEALKSTFANVANIEIIDTHELKITLKERNAGFLTALSAAVVPSGYTDNGKNPVGTGPFKFVEYVAAQKVVLAKNENYYIEGVPYLDEVEFRVLPDQEAAFLSFQSGEVDIYPRIGVEKAETLSTDKFTTIGGPQNLVQLLALNNAVEPFNNPAVREALDYAINKDELIAGVAIGRGQRLGSNLSPVLSSYFNADLVDLYPQDTEKAKQILADAGIENLSFEIIVPSVYPFHVATAEVIVYQLELAGIKATIKPVEWATWLEDVYSNREYTATIIGLDGKLDPVENLARYHSAAGNNFVNFANPAFDTALDAAKIEIDEAARQQYVKDAQAVLAEDHASIFIMDPETIIAFKNEVKGYVTYPIYVQDLSVVYLEQ
jgi:peptide/nickel transport system substrate-binding protein